MTDRARLPELLPCPFCGGEPDYDNDDRGGSWILCQSCGAKSGYHGIAGGAQKLYAAWNRRADLRRESAAPDGGLRERERLVANLEAWDSPTWSGVVPPELMRDCRKAAAELRATAGAQERLRALRAKNGKRPCDCASCDCGNFDDRYTVGCWDGSDWVLNEIEAAALRNYLKK